MSAEMRIAQVEHCDSMQDVRRNIDALDSEIVALLSRRCGYVAQAGRIKQHAHQIVDEARIEFIIDKVSAQAASLGAPPAVVASAYRALIAASIEFEQGEFKRLGKQG